MKNIRSKVKVQYKNLNTKPGRKLSNDNVPKQQNIKVKVKNNKTTMIETKMTNTEIQSLNDVLMRWTSSYVPQRPKRNKIKRKNDSTLHYL